MKILDINFGDGWKGSVDQYTSSKKRGKFYSVFCERPLADIPNSNEMWHFRFSRKDNVNDYGYFLYRIQKNIGADNEKWDEQMFSRANGKINSHNVPQILMDYIENIEQKIITKH